MRVLQIAPLVLVFGMLLNRSSPGDEIGGLTAPNTISLMAGKSAVLTLPQVYKKVNIASPSVADITLLNMKSVLITALSPGQTNLIIWLDDGSALHPIDVIVTPQPPTAPAQIASVTTSASPMFNPRLLWLPILVLPFFSLIGFFDAMISRGHGRSLVMLWIWTFFVLAEISFGWVMAAIGHGLPVRELWPSLLVSMVILFCTLLASRRMAQRYRDSELKRMQLIDAVSSAI